MKHFKTIREYCHAIQIPPPRYPHFDIRSFEENMQSVKHEMPTFRHEFYAIAVKYEGEGKAITGHHTDFPTGRTVFFNSPFQILSWKIAPDWKGYYLMFSQEYLAKSLYLADILGAFPFLKIDKAIPFEIDKADLRTILAMYTHIHQEYHSNLPDKFQIIEPYVLLLLNFVKRYFRRAVDVQTVEAEIKSADLRLLTRYQELIRESFYPNARLETFSNLHSTRYYADKLHVHPNHLNAVVKGRTGATALQHIHQHVLQLAKSHLAQTPHSVKEIAYALFFESPNNFSAFFKKHTGMTPLQYRKQAHL